MMFDQRSYTVEELRIRLDEFINEKIISIKYQLMAASSHGRLGIEYDFGSSSDDVIIDEIIQRLRDEDLTVEVYSTAPTQSKPYRISFSWDR